MQKYALTRINYHGLLANPLTLAAVIALGVFLDYFSTQAGLAVGLVESGNALFSVEFIALSGLAFIFLKVKPALAIIPVAFAFLPAINNFTLISGVP